MRYLIIFMLLLTSCSTNNTLQKYEPYQITQLEAPEPYTIDTNQLEQLNDNAITDIVDNQILVYITDDRIEFTNDINKSNGIVLYSDTYSKVADLATISGSYLDIIESQTQLINVKNDVIKELHTIIQLKEQQSLIYRDSFIQADQLFKSEHKLRKRDNIINNVKIVATVIGAIAILSL